MRYQKEEEEDDKEEDAGNCEEMVHVHLLECSGSPLTSAHSVSFRMPMRVLFFDLWRSRTEVTAPVSTQCDEKRES